jgi:hypothetical protein
MKKSNKLLLGGFLTVILIFAGIHIALFAKYKNGNYTLYHREVKDKGERMQKYPGVSFVIVRNVRIATILFGDTAAVEKGKEELIQYEQKGDSLVITGRNYNHDHPDERLQVNITLPYNVTIETDSVSSVSLQSKQFLKAKITTVSNNP